MPRPAPMVPTQSTAPDGCRTASATRESTSTQSAGRRMAPGEMKAARGVAATRPTVKADQYTEVRSAASSERMPARWVANEKTHAAYAISAPMHSQMVVSSGASTVAWTYLWREPRSMPQAVEPPSAAELKEPPRVGGDGSSGAGGADGVSSTAAPAHGSAEKTAMPRKATRGLPRRCSLRRTRSGAVLPPSGKQALTKLSTAPSRPDDPRHTQHTIVFAAALTMPAAAPTSR
eukprot:scaffold188_cov107-Isochrysis_galbana.AAC.21